MGIDKICKINKIQILDYLMKFPLISFIHVPLYKFLLKIFMAEKNLFLFIFFRHKAHVGWDQDNGFSNKIYDADMDETTK